MPFELLKQGAAFLFLGLCACASTTTSLDHEILARGSAPGDSGAGERFEVIETRPELHALYEEIFAGRLPPPPVPDVDFSRSLVLFVAMAQQPTAGYRVEMDPPVFRNGVLRSRVTFHDPPEGEPRATVLTRPFAVMKVNRPSGAEKVLFVDQAGNRLARIPLEQ